MLKILDRLINGREQKLKNNLKKYGLCPNNVTRFWENIGYKEFYFTTTSGVLILKVNRDSRKIFKFFKGFWHIYLVTGSVHKRKSSEGN